MQGSDDLTPQPPSQRTCSISEILDSEARYNSTLQTLKQYYHDPLTSANSVLSHKSAAEIFLNIGDIFTLTAKLHAALEQRIGRAGDLDTVCVGDVFVEFAPYLRLYSGYVMGFGRALELVELLMERNQKFRAFVKKALGKSEKYRLGLQALLLEPVQRLPRYKLMLESLLLHTPPSHLDHANLTQSLALLQLILSSINEKIRQSESLVVLLAIQKSLIGFTENLISTGRVLVKRGELMKVCRKNHQPRQVFLFSDAVVYTSKSGREAEFIFHRKIDLELVSVEGLPDLYGIKHAFMIISSVKSFTVYTSINMLSSAYSKIHLKVS